jgi:drug/metabolite transporter (DMT)-like permease
MGQPNPRQGDRSAQAALMVAVAVWGVNLSAVKVLTSTLDVLVVASSRMVVAVLALTAILFLTRQVRLVLQPRTFLGLIACGALMVYANQILFAASLSQTTATNAALVQALGPLVSTLIASATLRERLGGRRLAGLVVGFAGVAVVVLNRQGAIATGPNPGDLLMLASVVCFASGGALIQRLSAGLSAVQISWFVHVVGTVMLAGHTMALSSSALELLWDASAQAWGLIVFSGVGATALAALAWNHAIARIGIARTSLAFYWLPIFGLAFAAVALGERVTSIHIVGLVAVIAGSFLGRSIR